MKPTEDLKIFKNLLFLLASDMKMFLRYFLILLFFPVVMYSQTDSSVVPVEFHFQKKLTSPEVGVGINGSFNNWGNNPDGTGNNKHLIPMKNTGGDNWTVTFPIVAGIYEYKFVTYTVTSGDTTVSSWSTDPLNSNSGGPYNNSRITVADPMIYYLLPFNGKSINNPKPIISANISWGNSSSIDLSTLKLLIDNIQIPDAPQYFDTTTRVLSYTPTVPFTFTNHTVELSVQNNKGESSDLTTSFKILNEIISAPYTFIFDPLSPNFKAVGKINKVEIKGTFNNLGSDPMIGPDSSGVYRFTVPLNIGVPNFYQFIINGGQYINDPDNPLMEKDFGTVAVKRVDPNPHFEIVSPRQGQLFSPGSSVGIEAHIIESDSNYVIDKTSLKVLLDGNPLNVTSIDSIERGLDIKTSQINITEGRHQLKFEGADTAGNQAQYMLTFGSFGTNSGYHYVDADGDDNGPGNYTYPSFSSKGSADIKQIDINTNAANDSLLFTVSLSSISDYTRIGFEIINSLNGELSNAPDKAGIKIPDVSQKGIFFILTAPNSGQKSAYVNMIYDNFQLTSAIDTIAVNIDAEASGTFKFGIPINLVENVAGSFSKGWYFLAYSYFGNTSGGWKIPNGNGGSFFPESPNIYDAAFFYNTKLEKINLADYNFSFNYGGSRYVKFASNLRGVQFIRPGEISASLSGKPYVNILTNGGNMRWSDTVRVYVANSDPSITSGVLTDNADNYNLNFSNDTAYTDVVLSGGMNELQAYVNYGSNLKSYSTKVFFNRIIDHKPNIVIDRNINNGNVILDAGGTTNYDNFNQSYDWAQDSTNPQKINFNSASSAAVSFAVPKKIGEYFYTLNCRTTKDTSFERVALVVDSSGIHFPDLNTWHANWIDSARIYEVFVRTLSLDGDLKAVTRKISYIKSLGCNTIWLMPIYPGPPLSPSQPGYAITNYFNVNPAYGTLADFKNFVDEAHANGIKVVLDYVVDHTHNTHPFMLDAYKYGNKSPYYNFYKWNTDGTYKYLYTWTDFPFINFELQRNRDYLLDAAKFWLENYNIDGFRCDAAMEVNDLHPGGAIFWQQFRNTLKTIKPDIFLLGELSATNLKYFDKKFDSGYDYSFYNTIKNAISNNNLLPSLQSAIDYYHTKNYPGYTEPFRFIENHDQSRFISQFGLPETKLAAAELLTLPGVPMIYAGQEVGEESFRGLINWSDPDNLTPFYQKLLSIRRDYKAFSFGKYKDVTTSSPDSIFAFARLSDTLSTVVLSNFTGGSTQFYFNIDSLNLKIKPGTQYYFNDVLNNAVYPVNSNSHMEMTLPGYGSAILVFADKPFITSVNDNYNKPLTYSLDQNYPNPFNPTTTIRYSIGGQGTAPVKIIVYNVLGQKIRTLVNDVKAPGYYQVLWNGRNNAGEEVSSGVYFYLLKVNNFIQTKKMLLLK